MLTINPITTSADEATAIDTINAIYDYVRDQRANVDKYPALLPLIQGFESWYQGLDASVNPGGIAQAVSHVVNTADVNEAKRRRDDINTAMGEKIPDTVTPADGPQTPPPKPDDNSSIDTGIKLLAAAGAAFILWKLFT